MSNKKLTSNEKIVRRLLRIDDHLDGIDFVVDAYNDLKLTDDIDVQMDMILHDYQMSGVLESHADQRFEIKKIELDEFRGELDEYAREIEVMSRPTDARVKAYIDRHPEYVKRKKKLFEYKRRLNVLKHLNRAFYMKYEFLRTKSANIRREYGDLTNHSSENIIKEKKKKLKKKRKKKIGD